MQLTFIVFFLTSFLLNADPITNIRYYIVSDDRMIVYYDLESERTADVSVSLHPGGGNGDRILLHGLSGDAGSGVHP